MPLAGTKEDINYCTQQLTKDQIMTENASRFSIAKNDAISFLQSFEDGSVDTIITDPPYCSYGVGSSGNKYSAKASERSYEIECGNDILFDNKDFFSNFMFFKVWAAECLRVFKG